MRKIYTNLNKRIFWITLSLSIVLMVVSFCMPPRGEIDSSVIMATGELFAFATLASVIEAIDKGKRVTLKKGETEMEVSNENNE